MSGNEVTINQKDSESTLRYRMQQMELGIKELNEKVDSGFEKVNENLNKVSDSVNKIDRWLDLHDYKEKENLSQLKSEICETFPMRKELPSIIDQHLTEMKDKQITRFEKNTSILHKMIYIVLIVGGFFASANFERIMSIFR